jgi:iron-sulfur cluster assembly protein
MPVTHSRYHSPRYHTPRPLFQSTESASSQTTSSDTTESVVASPIPTSPPLDYEIPDDAVILIQPRAMQRLQELRKQQGDKDKSLVLRMGVRSGGCSGMSYVMDIAKEDDVISEDDTVDEYPGMGVTTVVDAKSMLYLYGLQLDYSDELVGGGFKFMCVDTKFRFLL